MKRGRDEKWGAVEMKSRGDEKMGTEMKRWEMQR